MYEDDLHVMDWKRLHMFTDGDPDETKELIDLFTEHAQETLSLMHELCSDEPDENWKQAVHKLKRSAANLGAEVLAKHCKLAEAQWTEPYVVKQAAMQGIAEQYSIVCGLLENPVLEVKNEDW